MTEFTLHPIGYVASPFQKHGDAPRQGRLTDELSTITIEPEFRKGLEGMHTGENLFIFCWFDRADRTVLESHVCGMEEKPITGVFTSRSPNRPNPVALTLVKLIRIEENILTVQGLEAFDGTPVIDIKPYYGHLDSPRSE
ncbi:MAG: tRNA (N6-threonylcarbamoyladenosine(37)-N6)-methyltransferase TrmO [Methanocorpusculum sp.]|nr:tRNA (N6-threonylcarbamoyladenosine(37)-N6)-methyltransferase TrmO [Methanocorpusculum sp.]